MNEKDLCHMQITPQHNLLKTRVTSKLATAFTYLIYKAVATELPIDI